ncbi:MAG: hypothetical protein EPN75_05605 [Beijerinckiaceae bacterium]|nr:MAG: hypothetical protein EPN75_05605 [Beijerinckiaceae bacterium]
MQRIQPKPQPKPQLQPKLKPQPKSQPESRSNQHRHNYNPATVRRPIPKAESTSIGKPKTIFIRHGILEHDGSYCTFFEDEQGREVNKYGDPIRYDDDDENPTSFAPVEKRTTKKIKAAELLQKWLRNGPVAVSRIKSRAEAAGISWSTIDKARYELGLVAIKGTGKSAGWFWLLPQ